MNSAIERLLTLRVADAMSKEVVCVSLRDSMAEAAQKLVKHSISGAPVVDEEQRCAGMLSAIDFVKKQAQPGKSGEAGQRGPHKGDGSHGGDPFAGDLVRDHMTAPVTSIAASQPLLAAARAMCGRHIHRLPVQDDEGRTIGIITALDVVAALINAIEE
jgi:CBS domain-containing membrane protein